jgi:hypothetical protein
MERNGEMLENMSGFVGQETHAERQRRAAGTASGRGDEGRENKRAGITARVAIAKALVTLATRLAPSVTTSTVASAP